ncbi:hypothetical protein I552_2899 [Mycobacterium xenopi 3993]|nr:hypothetical protein I552_2899 [Mycobacterium xenopi 3993]
MAGRQIGPDAMALNQRIKGALDPLASSTRRGDLTRPAPRHDVFGLGRRSVMWLWRRRERHRWSPNYALPTGWRFTNHRSS